MSLDFWTGTRIDFFYSVKPTRVSVLRAEFLPLQTCARGEASGVGTGAQLDASGRVRQVHTPSSGHEAQFVGVCAVKRPAR